MRLPLFAPSFPPPLYHTLYPGLRRLTRDARSRHFGSSMGHGYVACVPPSHSYIISHLGSISLTWLHPANDLHLLGKPFSYTHDNAISSIYYVPTE